MGDIYFRFHEWGEGEEGEEILRSHRGAVRIFGHGGHFSWQVQGKPRAWWSVTHSLTHLPH